MISYKNQNITFSESSFALKKISEFHPHFQKEEDIEYLEFDDIDDIYQQIEICWKTYDYDPLINLLQQFRNWIDQKEFHISDSFVNNEVDNILFNLIDNHENDTSQKDIFFLTNPSFILRSLSISIIHDLLTRFYSFFSQESLLNFIRHAIPIIRNWETEFILKILDCFLILCDKVPIFMQNYIDFSFFLSILDQRYNLLNDRILYHNDYSFFYDGYANDPASLMIKSILLKLPPNIKNISIILNNRNCGMKQFSIFLWISIQNPSLILDFDSSLYMPKLNEILTKSHDYSLIFPSIIFLTIICDRIKVNDIILLLFPYITICDQNLNGSVGMISPFNIKPHSSESIIDNREINIITKVCSISLYCLSRFASIGSNETIFCIEHGIIDIILSCIHSETCQNQIKRETSRLLCRLITNTPQNPDLHPVIKIFYQCEDIINLLLNTLEYDEIDMDELILQALIFLLMTQVFDLSTLLSKCYENIDIFYNLLNNEKHEISSLAHQFLNLFERKSKIST